MQLDTFTRAYIQCALWTTDENPLPGEWQEHFPYCLSNLDILTQADMMRDCFVFQMQNTEDIGLDLKEAGHDFWLTRNDHGSGFWDGDWIECVGERLTRAAKQFGLYTLYLGDDGKLYGCK